jgi:hypothetical protein
VLEKAGFGGQREFEPSVSLNFFLPVIRPCETKTADRGNMLAPQPGVAAARSANNLSFGSGFIWMK